MSGRYYIAGPYKLRRFTKSRDAWQFTVPRSIVEIVGTDRSYNCELTDDGILFRPTENQPRSEPIPEWAKAIARRALLDTDPPASPFKNEQLIPPKGGWRRVD